MRKTKIEIQVTLDDQNIPESITWKADDNGNAGANEANAINLSFWDGGRRETMKMDLWTKSMPVHEMKMFYVDMLGSMSDSIYNATGDEEMAGELKKVGERLMTKLENEFKK